MPAITALGKVPWKLPCSWVVLACPVEIAGKARSYNRFTEIISTGSVRICPATYSDSVGASAGCS
jgi:hypothetical protein